MLPSFLLTRSGFIARHKTARSGMSSMGRHCAANRRLSQDPTKVRDQSIRVNIAFFFTKIALRT